MPSTVEEHYESLLAEHYDWMFGDSIEVRVQDQKALLRELAGEPGRGELAVDLGCGSGVQSLALNEMGYRVLALDTSRKLLAQLAATAGTGRGVTPQLGDIRQLDQYVATESAAIIVCMGDTLTHLSSRQEVSELLTSVARALQPGGTFIVSYRDLAATELLGLDRFIPIRGDGDRLMTCFLEYAGVNSVVVHDLIHVRDAANHWTLHKSCYRKLRLPLDWVCAQLEAAGLSIRHLRPGRLATLVAVKRRGA